MAGEFKLAEAFVELKATGITDTKRHLAGLKGTLASIGSAFGALGKRIAGAFSPLRLAIGGALGGMGIKGLLNLASTAEETGNKFRQVFGDQAEAADQFATDLAASLGRSRTEIRDSMSAFQGFFVGMGFGGDEARQMSQQLQSLAMDFASFHNISDAEAMERFISALSGSSEVLDRFGVNIKASALDQELLSMGINKTTAQATEQEKAMARLNVIMRAMGQQGAIGDAMRTSDSFANSMKRMWATLKELGETVGKILMPIFSGLGNILGAMAEKANQFITGELPELQRILETVKAVLDGIASAIRGSSFSGWSKQLADAFRDAADILMASIKAIGQFLMSIAVQVGQLIGDGIVAAIAAVVPGGGAAADLWKEVKIRTAMTGARLAGSTKAEARKEAEDAVNGPGASPMAALARSAAAAFGAGSELQELFGRLAEKYAMAAGVEKPAGPAQLELGAKDKGPVVFELPEKTAAAVADAVATKTESFTGGIHSFASMWDAIQGRHLTKDGEEIVKVEKEAVGVQKDILAALKTKAAALAATFA